MRREGLVSTRLIVESLGTRSFGPLLLVTGLVTLAPIVGDIPGVPTVIGVLVALVAVQLLLGRDHFWLPDWILNRRVQRGRALRVLDWTRPVARFLDRISRRRLVAITQGVGLRLVAIACIVIAGAMPLLELIPFSANAAGAALTLFGLSLVAGDGLLAGLGLILTGAVPGIILLNLA